MSRPTAAQLLARLREVYAERDGKPLSEEKLAGRLPITLSTFNRWKKRDTKAFSDIVQMLDDAGWLNDAATDLAAETGRPANSEDVAASLLLGQAEGLEILRRIETALQSEREARTPAAQTKRAASRRKR